MKRKSDAFSNPELDAFLKLHEVKCVEVVGVDGGACVALTAMGAVRHGYKVIMNQAAIGTMFDKRRDRYHKKLEKEGVEFI